MDAHRNTSRFGCTWRCAARDIAAMRDVLQKIPQIMLHIIADADNALYCSKRAGRNCISWSEPREHAAATDPHADAGRDKV